MGEKGWRQKGRKGEDKRGEKVNIKGEKPGRKVKDGDKG